MHLGLDWDDSVTAYPKGFAALAGVAERITVITLNDDLTESEVRSILKVPRSVPLSIHVCPTARVQDGAVWKREVAEQSGVDVFLDDDEAVGVEMIHAGVPFVYVGWSAKLSSG